MACINIEIIETYIHSDDIQYLYAGRRWSYRASIDDDSTVMEDTVVHLSYVGSTAIFGISFDGPREVIITSGNNYIDFEVEVFFNIEAYDKYINVLGLTDDFISCNVNIIKILSLEETPGYIEPAEGCCKYYDRTYEIWRDYFPTCMGNNTEPEYPGKMLKDGSESLYDWE